MRTMTLQDDGVPGAGATVQQPKRPCPHWLRDIVWCRGERGEWAGRMGPVRWRCQRHEHPKEQKLLQNKHWRWESVGRQWNSRPVIQTELWLRSFRRERHEGKQAGLYSHLPDWNRKPLLPCAVETIPSNTPFPVCFLVGLGNGRCC